MNISEELNILNTAKQDIKSAIIEKGQTVGDNMHEYADAIKNISGGGSEDTNDYLCFEAVEDSAISLSNFRGNAPNIEYSFDKQTWTTWDYNNIDLLAGQKLYMRGDNPNGFSKYDGTEDGIYSKFELVGSIILFGNFMTLVNKTGNVSEVPANCFNRLFDCAIDTPSSFALKDCMATLPCDVLNYACYRFMFSRNASLSSVPALPATTLAPLCYIAYTFGCSALKEAPYLPAKTLVGQCYVNMFRNCTSLQYIKAEFTTTPSTNYTSNWVSGVASTGCFIKAKDATWTTKSTSACPSSWTLITSVS